MNGNFPQNEILASQIKSASNNIKTVDAFFSSDTITLDNGIGKFNPTEKDVECMRAALIERYRRIMADSALELFELMKDR